MLKLSPWDDPHAFNTFFGDRDGLKRWRKAEPSELNQFRLSILCLTLRGVMVRRRRTDLFDGQPLYKNPGSETVRMELTTSKEERMRQGDTKWCWDPELNARRKTENSDENPLKGYKREDVLSAFTVARCSAVHPACPGAYAEFKWLDTQAADDIPAETSTQQDMQRARQSRTDFIASRRQDWQLSTKVKTCVELAKAAKAASEKILFFYEFQSAVDVVSAALLESGISHVGLNGTMDKAERKATVDAFGGRSGSPPDENVAMLLTSAGGEGIDGYIYLYVRIDASTPYGVACLLCAFGWLKYIYW